jgi:hypothetical protein
MADSLKLPTLPTLDTFDPSSAGPQNQNVVDYSHMIEGAAGSGGPTNPPGCTGVGCPAGTSDHNAGTLPISSGANPTPTGGPSWWDVLTSGNQSSGVTMDQARANVKAGLPATTPGAPSSFSVGRLAAFIGGLIFIAGGIYLLGAGAPTALMVDRAIGAGHGR